MNKILVTGSKGQLGSEIESLSSIYPQYDFFFTNVHSLDIFDKLAIESYVIKNKINVIINCAAFTAVDKAESEFELANKINNISVMYLADVAKLNKCKLVHISTDYVFDGYQHKPYSEKDIPNPQNIYGKTKLGGEIELKKVNPKNSIIIRTSWVFSSYGNNFVKTMLKLGDEKSEINVIDDQIGNPTYAADLAKSILEILPEIKNNEVEIYNYSNEGSCSWYDFAKAIFENNKVNCKISPIKTYQYSTAATRPNFSLLCKKKIKNKFKIVVPHWSESLKECLTKINIKSKI